MARTEVHTTVRRIRRQLHSGHRLETASLATAVDSDDTAIIFQDDLPSSVKTNAILDIGVELMRVRSINTGTKTATVVRAAADSEADDHAVGDEISINPRFSKLDIYDALVAELNSWGPDLFRVEADVFAYPEGSQTVELPIGWEGFYRVLAMSGKRTVADWDTTAPTKWPGLAGSVTRAPVATLSDALNSGLLLRVPDVTFSGSVYVAVAMPLLADEVALTADLVEDVGVPASALDIVDMGVKRRLIIDSEFGRSGRDVQGDTRSAAENPAGSNVPVLRVIDAQYFRRISEEHYKLLALWPQAAS